MKVNISGKRAQQVSDPAAFKDKVNLSLSRATFISKVYNTKKLSNAILTALDQLEIRKLRKIVSLKLLFFRIDPWLISRYNKPPKLLLMLIYL